MWLYTGKREIRALQVKCNYSNCKCDWTGALGDLQKHMTTCKYKPADEVDRFLRIYTDGGSQRKAPLWSGNAILLLTQVG